MARTIQVSISSVKLPLGTFTRTSSTLAPSDSYLQLVLQQGADWVHDGSHVFDLSLGYAPDGVTFNQNLWSVQAFDTAIPARFGQPADQMSWGVTIPDVGTTTRKVQFTLTVLERRTVSGSLLSS